MADLHAFMQSLAAQQFTQSTVSPPALPSASLPLSVPVGFPSDQSQALAYYAAYILHQQQQQQQLQQQQVSPQALLARLAELGGGQGALAALGSPAKDAAQLERGADQGGAGAALLRMAGGAPGVASLKEAAEALETAKSPQVGSNSREVAQHAAG